MSYFKAKMHQIRFRLGLRRRVKGFSLYLSIRVLRKGPGKFLMGSWKVLEKSLIFLSIKEWEPRTNEALNALKCSASIAADSIVDAFSFIRRIVLWSENKFFPNPAPVPDGFQFLNPTRSTSGWIWKSQIQYNPKINWNYSIDSCGHDHIVLLVVVQQTTSAQNAQRASRQSSISRCIWWSTATRSLFSVTSATTHSTARTSSSATCWSTTQSNTTSARCKLAPVLLLLCSVFFSRPVTCLHYMQATS